MSDLSLLRVHAADQGEVMVTPEDLDLDRSEGARLRQLTRLVEQVLAGQAIERQNQATYRVEVLRRLERIELRQRTEDDTAELKAGLVQARAERLRAADADAD